MDGIRIKNLTTTTLSIPGLSLPLRPGETRWADLPLDLSAPALRELVARQYVRIDVDLDLGENVAISELRLRRDRSVVTRGPVCDVSCPYHIVRGEVGSGRPARCTLFGSERELDWGMTGAQRCEPCLLLVPVADRQETKKEAIKEEEACPACGGASVTWSGRVGREYNQEFQLTCQACGLQSGWDFSLGNCRELLQLAAGRPSNPDRVKAWQEQKRRARTPAPVKAQAPVILPVEPEESPTVAPLHLDLSDDEQKK